MGKIIRTILIDDDDEALIVLEMYLKTCRNLVIVGKTGKGEEALALVAELRPDLIFLDIDMPGINGIEVAQKIKEHNYNTGVIFTTAYSSYAYDVIKTEPFGYLVKPFAKKELVSLVNQFGLWLDKNSVEQNLEMINNVPQPSGKLKFKTYLGYFFVSPDEIAIIKAHGNNCELFLTDGTKELVSITMRMISSVIKHPNFYKINRSTYINLLYLRKVDSKKKACYLAFNKTNHKILLTDKGNVAKNSW